MCYTYERDKISNNFLDVSTLVSQLGFTITDTIARQQRSYKRRYRIFIKSIWKVTP